MTSFPSELRNSSPSILLQLLNSYYVRTHQGEIYSGNNDVESILNFIHQWLQPEPVKQETVTDPVKAIREKVTFSLDDALNKNVLDQIFGETIPVAIGILDDFANYPMRVSFNTYNPWDLLIGYIQSENQANYFYQITGKNPKIFLNHTERIFYLTRGYGRPNKYISTTDNALRKFYMKAAPTALIALSDIFGICPTRQNPDVVLERFSDTNLKSIDQFHKDIVQKITECLHQMPICQLTQSSSLLTFPLNTGGSFDDFSITDKIIPQECGHSKIVCFKQFLNSIGMLPIFDFDPFSNVFISNISQIEQYRSVQPTKVWNFEEVRNLPYLIVASVIHSLPDNQLVAITVPKGFRYADSLDFSRLVNRLRTRLVSGAIEFLTQPRHYQDNQNIFYGRLIDDNIQSMTLSDLLASISTYGALIDPYNNVINVNAAESLNENLRNEILRQAILKTRARMLENIDLINVVTLEQKEQFIQVFRTNAEYNLNIENLNKSFTGPIRKLILWSKQNEWVPVAINFDEYFKLWDPLFKDVIKDTLNYYLSIFEIGQRSTLTPKIKV